MQDAVPLSQEAEHNLRCSCQNARASLYSLVLGEVFEKPHGCQFLLADKDPSCVFWR